MAEKTRTVSPDAFFKPNHQPALFRLENSVQVEIEDIDLPPETSVGAKPAFPPGHNRRLRELRGSIWYEQQLRELGFQPKDIRSDKNFAAVLYAYGRCLEESPESDLTNDILRFALRQTVKDQNKRLAHDICQYFTDKYDYDHKRACPYKKRAYLNKDGAMPLKYKNASAIRIINSVGAQALFQASPNKIKIEILKQNSGCYSINADQVNNLSIYALLPNQFLIGRIWAVRKLCSQLEGSSYNALLHSIKTFEALNRTIRYDLIDHKPFYQHTGYYHLHFSQYTQPIGKVAESLFSVWQDEQSACA